MQDQLTLGIRLRDETTFENYYEGDNQEILLSLKKLVDNSAWNFIYLYGHQDVGKSHLLQACCHYATSKGGRSFYLLLEQGVAPLVLEDLEQFSLVCIDNIDCIGGEKVWEESLFHFFNHSVSQKTKLVIAGPRLPAQVGIRLRDLTSRLASGITYLVKPLSDCQKLEALQLRALIRGFDLSDEVGRYLLNHYPRNMKVLFDLLEILDLASLEAQHRLTIPFVKYVLNKKV